MNSGIKEHDAEFEEAAGAKVGDVDGSYGSCSGSDDGMMRERGPVDKHYTAYFIIVLLGVGLLLPWNAVIGAVDYFSLIYPNTKLMFYFPMAYIYPSVPLLFVMIKYGDRMSFSVRIVTCFLVEGAALCILPLVAGVADKTVSLTVIMGTLFCAGCATAVLQASLFGFASMMPGVYTQAIMVGNGVAGIITSGLRIATKASLPHTADGLRQSAHIYFFLSATVMLLCIVGYVFLIRLEFTRYHISKAGKSVPSAKASASSTVSDDDPASTLATPILGQDSLASASASHALGVAPGVGDGLTLDETTDGGGTGADDDADSCDDEDEDSAGSSGPGSDAEEDGTRRDADGEDSPLSRSAPTAGLGGMGGSQPAAARKGRRAKKRKGKKQRRVDQVRDRLMQASMSPGPMSFRHFVGSNIASPEDSKRSGAGGSGAAGNEADSEFTDASSVGTYDPEAVAVYPTGSPPAAAAATGPKPGHAWRVLAKVWDLGAAVTLVFVMTFVVFPGEVSLIKYRNSFPALSFLSGDWWAIVMILLFNIFDLVGRFLPGVVVFLTERTLWITIWARFAMAPLFVFASHDFAGFTFGDWMPLLLMPLFAFTNGYTSSLTMMWAPGRVKEHESEVSGFIMGFFLQVGILLGSLLALILQKV